MENAQKALLIAAGISIAIMLIAFGIKIFSSFGNAVDQAESIGKSLSIATEDSIDVFKGYEIVRSTKEIVDNPANLYYNQYPTNVVLSYDYIYTITYDYEVLENSNNDIIGCGIGFCNPDTNVKYAKDIIYCKDFSKYSEGTKGKFEISFKLSDYNSAADYYDNIVNKRKCIYYN